MAFSPKSKPWTQFPYDASMSDQSKACLDWVVTQLNQLIGQASVPSGSGIQNFGTPLIDPTGQQITSAGSRTSSITTAIAYTSTTTSVSFWWDGSNGSSPFKIYRDDGSITGPIVAGSGITVGGLSPSTLYYFYFYWDEGTQSIKMATVQNVGVGTPPNAFTAQNTLALQQIILRGRIPLATLFYTQGITTPASGSGGGSGGGGGGGGGSGGGGHQLT